MRVDADDNDLTHGLARESVVLLCAGASQRMGTPKGLLDYFGKPWLREQLLRLQHCGLQHCIVVLGAASDRYLSEVAELTQNGHGVFAIDVALNPDWKTGPFSSVLAGLAHPTLRNKNGCFVHLIDVPVPNATVWVSLLQTMRANAQAFAASPTFDEHGGHPVYLKQKLREQLLAVPLTSPDARLDVQLRKLGELHARVPVETHDILTNFNTPDEWDAFKHHKQD